MDVNKKADDWLVHYQAVFETADVEVGEGFSERHDKAIQERERHLHELRDVSELIAPLCVTLGLDPQPLLKLASVIGPNRSGMNVSFELMTDCRALVNQLTIQAFPSPPPSPPEPPVVTYDHVSGTITYEGKIYSEVDPDACQLLQELVEAYSDGERIGLNTSARPQARRVIEKLPESIQGIIDINQKGSILKFKTPLSNV